MGKVKVGNLILTPQICTYHNNPNCLQGV